MTAQHTPGPWSHQEGLIYAEAAGHITLIAEEEDRANAALIAESPNLLTTLQETRTALQNIPLSSSTPERAAIIAIVKNIDAAIAKATGGKL